MVKDINENENITVEETEEVKPSLKERAKAFWSKKSTKIAAAATVVAVGATIAVIKLSKKGEVDEELTDAMDAAKEVLENN